MNLVRTKVRTHGVHGLAKRLPRCTIAWDDGSILPLEVVGLLLTAALIGAVIIAMEEQARHAPEGSQSH